jgi:hypothetical protein
MAKAWLNVQYEGKNIAGEYQIVFHRHQAVEMSDANAQQLMRAAQIAYPNYRWEMVAVSNWFIVEGTKKE